jgi:HlyD family secretion protein
MDRKIEHKTRLRKKHIPWFLGGTFIIVVAAWLIFGDHRSSLRVDSRTITVAVVKQGEFNDYVRVNGIVQPITTVQLTPLEGGIVQEILIEEGSSVRKGEIIIKLSNPQLNIEILSSEASLAEKENWLRNTRVEMEKQKLELRRERLSLEKTVEQKKRKYEQTQSLYAENLCSKEEFLQAKEEYEFDKKSMELVIERQVQDSIYRTLQVDNMEYNLRSMQQNMALVRQRVQNLNVTSPIDGELGLLDAVLGQSISSGQKMGQINDLSNYKIEAMIDEHYIDRVMRGLLGAFERGGEKYQVQVSKVFPEVRGGQFRTWLTFTGARPDNIRTGQTYYINLELGQPTQGIIIPRGAFYQTTGGNWIFVVEGNKAVRRPVKIGRQNPQYYEVLEGLNPGEKVIVSSYEMYKNNEVLMIND